MGSQSERASLTRVSNGVWKKIWSIFQRYMVKPNEKSICCSENHHLSETFTAGR